jgi:hypothetical protein
VIAKLVERLRDACFLEVGRGGTNDAPIGRKFAGDEGGIAQLADADGNIELIANDIDEVVGNMEIELNVRVTRKELRQQRCQVETGKGRRCSHSEQAGRIGFARADEFFGFGGPLQDSFGMPEIAFAYFRQRNMPGRSLEEPRAKALFEVA